MHRLLLEGTLVVATHNQGKLREIKELFEPYNKRIQLVSAGELSLSEPIENGNSFQENARIKARAATQATSLPAISEDSGIVIEALGGEPGIHSARWAGPDKDFRYAMNRIQTLLVERGATTPDQRRAHFFASLCLAWPDGHMEEFEGRINGHVVWPPLGEKGFGYDPIFLPEGHDRTFGEMTADEKHGLPPRGMGLSHRARAFVKLADACLKA
jgi:XTP/dITP diphosphohydrolase